MGLPMWQYSEYFHSLNQIPPSATTSSSTTTTTTTTGPTPSRSRSSIRRQHSVHGSAARRRRLRLDQPHTTLSPPPARSASDDEPPPVPHLDPATRDSDAEHIAASFLSRQYRRERLQNRRRGRDARGTGNVTTAIPHAYLDSNGVRWDLSTQEGLQRYEQALIDRPLPIPASDYFRDLTPSGDDAQDEDDADGEQEENLELPPLRRMGDRSIHDPPRHFHPSITLSPSSAARRVLAPSLSRSRSRSPGRDTNPYRERDRVRTTDDFIARAASDYVDSHTRRRVTVSPSRLRQEISQATRQLRSTGNPNPDDNSTVDGLGDRQRSPDRDHDHDRDHDDNQWDTMLSTITPDPSLPSFSSSFASGAAASFPGPDQRESQAQRRRRTERDARAARSRRSRDPTIHSGPLQPTASPLLSQPVHFAAAPHDAPLARPRPQAQDMARTPSQATTASGSSVSLSLSHSTTTSASSADSANTAANSTSASDPPSNADSTSSATTPPSTHPRSGSRNRDPSGEDGTEAESEIWTAFANLSGSVNRWLDAYRWLAADAAGDEGAAADPDRDLAGAGRARGDGLSASGDVRAGGEARGRGSAGHAAREDTAQLRRRMEDLAGEFEVGASRFARELGRGDG